MKLLKNLFIVLGIFFVIERAIHFIKPTQIEQVAATDAMSKKEQAKKVPDWGVQTGKPGEQIVRADVSAALNRSSNDPIFREADDSAYEKQTGFRPGLFRFDNLALCYYDDKDGTWYTNPATGWTMQGHYDLTGKTKGKVRDVSIVYYTEYNAILNSACTVEPEWGNSYVDEECKKRQIDNFKEDLYNVVYKNKFEGKNIYKICANTCGGGIGHCDETMYD